MQPKKQEEASVELEHNPEIIDRYPTDDFRNVIFEKINDKYSRGKLGPFEIIMINDTGYVNATKLCAKVSRETGCLKEYKKCHNLKGTKELLDEINLTRTFPARYRNNS